MKKTILGSILAGAFVTAMAVGAQAEEIKFGVAAEPYPPMSSKDASGTWVGWEIDMMNAVCDELKKADAATTCTLVETAWDGIIPSLQEKKIDVIWSSMTITDKRKLEIDFTTFYYDSPSVIIGAKSDTTQLDVNNPASAEGKVFGAQTSTIHADFVTAKFGSVAEVKVYDTLDNAIADLAAGAVDYLQEGKSSFQQFLNSDRGKDFEIKIPVPQDSIMGYGVGGGVRKEDTALRDRLSAAIGAVVASGKWDEITAKWPDVGELVKPGA
ncbi:MAG: transporter substrate-binding domain-containing protein [Rhodospirillaceae bacterium]|nr:transporter substrate-binding domain-containing protein [Rhodospirillaceae bacterium]